ncbi:MAG: hypothetical protein SGJ00_05710 [bacterium]|nr:hypothetical protein [bacterium]
MNKFYALILMALVLVGCSDAKFDRLPGQFQDVIPQELQGKFQYFGKDFKSRITDTLLVEVGTHEIKFGGTKGKFNYTINRDFTIHKLGDLYILGTKDKTVRELWNLSVVQMVDNGLRVHFVREDKLKRDEDGPIQQYLAFQDVMLQHDPLPGAPVPISGGVEMGEGNGPVMVRFYMASDDQFKTYFESELKNKEYMLLSRDPKDKNYRKPKK